MFISMVPPSTNLDVGLGFIDFENRKRLSSTGTAYVRHAIELPRSAVPRSECCAAGFSELPAHNGPNRKV